MNNTDERSGLVSASRFEILALCPGSEALRKTLPPEALASDNEWSAMGTRIHAAAETGNVLELSPEELEIYESGMRCEKRIVQSWQEELGIESFREGPREERYWVHDERTLRPLTSAKLDRHYISIEPAGFILSVDWKSLWSRNLTPAIQNYQGRVQAVSVAKEYEARHVRMAFNKAMFGIADVADYDANGLWRAEFSIAQAVWESEQTGAPLRPGDHCKYCPCKAYCKAAVTEAMIPAAYAPQPLPEKVTPKRAVELVAQIPIEAVREAWGRRTQIKNVIDAMAARLKALPPEEKYRLGLKMNLGRSNDTIRDVKIAFDAMIAAGFPEEGVWGCLKMSKSAVVELFQKIRNCREGEAEKWYEMQFDDYIERGRGDEVLAEA